MNFNFIIVKVKKMKKILIPIMLSLLLFMSIASATVVYVDPQEIEKLSVGKTFDVNIKIEDVQSLYAYELKLKYNTDILDVENIAPSTFLNQPTSEIKKMIDEENGFVWYATTSINPAAPKSGSGTLAVVTFKVTGQGKSDLKLYDITLTDYDIKMVEHSVRNSVFDNSGISISNKTLSTILLLIILVIIAIFLLSRNKSKKKSKK